MKTLKQLAQDALDVQNACNLSGVVKGFDRAIADLKSQLGSDINHHPIVLLWLDKIASLTGTQANDICAMSKAYDIVEQLAQ